MRDTALQIPRSLKKDRAAILPQPVGKTTVKQAVSLKPIEVWARADIHVQPVEDPTLENVGARRRV